MSSMTGLHDEQLLMSRSPDYLRVTSGIGRAVPYPLRLRRLVVPPPGLEPGQAVQETATNLGVAGGADSVADSAGASPDCAGPLSQADAMRIASDFQSSSGLA